MRNSWKTVAENLVICMSRDQMEEAYIKILRALESYEREGDRFQADAAFQTVSYLRHCMREYDVDHAE